MVERGLDHLDISLGFTTLNVNMPWGTPGMMLPIAQKLRREVKVLLGTQGFALTI